MRITFYGGAGGVTGSKHLLEVGKVKILLDCGTFQGHRREAKQLNSSLPFSAASIDAVVLSHGHLDHCGMLPLLVKQGYAGSIYTTPATLDVTAWILRDAAHIQEMDAQYMNKHAVEGSDLAEPIFTQSDVDAAMKQFVAVPYGGGHGAWTTIAQGVRIKFYEAGHILGSAVTVLEVEDDGEVKRLAFTGDLGRSGTPIINDPEYILEDTATLIMESTYGNRVHRPIADAVAHLEQVVNETVKNKGKIIIPSFALGRTQELVYVLHELTDLGKIPRVPIYVDSPLASNISQVFMKHTENYDVEAWADFGKRGDTPLAFRNLTYIQSQEESKQLNSLAGPFMVISASGMCEAGRILHHLANTVSDKNNVVLITGFQAEHTLGRRLLEGQRSIRIFGTPHRVEARVEVLNEFSAHADSLGLQDYAEHITNLKNVFLVHGEHTQAVSLQDKLLAAHPDWLVHVPAMGESFVV